MSDRGLQPKGWGAMAISGHGPDAGWRAPGEMYHYVIYFRRFWQSGFLMSSKNARPTGASRGGDFATNSRLILLSAFALVIGVVSTVGAAVLLAVMLVPVLGGLIVRFGSEKMRGHGIPEA